MQRQLAMQTANHHRRRCLFASIGLLAVTLLYAPLVGAAWASYSASCCAAGQCSIPQHHHREAPAHHMDCGHDMPGMTACSISCCQNSDRPLTASFFFVLPAPVQLSEPPALTSSIHFSTPLNFLHAFEPLSPPPRLVSAAV